MKAKKRNIIIVVVAIVLLGSWLTIKANVEKEAKRAILDSPLDDLIEYRDLSVDLFDKSVTLYDVEFSRVDEDKAPVLEAITLVGFDQLSEWLEDESNFPEVLTVQVTGLKFDLHEMLKNQTLSVKKGSEGLLYNLALLGYQLADFEGKLQIKYDKDDQLLNLSANVYADNVTKIKFKSEVSRVREKLLNSLRFKGESGKGSLNSSMVSMLSKLQTLKTNSAKSALNQFSIEVDDDGLMDKVNYFYAVESMKLPGEQGSSIFDAERKEKEISSLVREGVAKSFATELVNKVAEFVENPGTIKVETDIDTPIRFSKLMDGKPSKFLKRLNLQVH